VGGWTEKEARREDISSKNNEEMKFLLMFVLFLPFAQAHGKDDFLLQHTTSNVRRLLQKLASSDVEHLQMWTREPERMGKPYTRLCARQDKALVEDLLKAHLDLARNPGDNGLRAEIYWATFNLMLTEPSDKKVLVELLDRTESLMKSSKAPIAGYEYALEEQGISLYRQFLAIPPPEFLGLPRELVACHALNHPVPSFPAERAIEVEQVQLKTRIGLDGKVKSAFPIRNQSDYWSQVAIETVKGTRYSPFYAMGQPIEVETVITVDFRCPRPKSNCR
jgi:hypothetical protein